MEQWTEIRRRVLVEGVSKRQILRETGMHWSTLQKILTNSAPPGYRQSQPRPQPKIGPYRDRIQQILMADRELPRKQRHTAKRIWERLQEEGYTGGYTAVKEAVRETEQQNQEVFVPLVHRPGEAQVDFGEAVVRLGGELRVVKFLLMALPYSDAFFVMAFERECTETFGEGHVQAFQFFGGVPRRISYDNTRIAVAQIIGTGRARKLTTGFLQLQSHYLFEHHFCRVRRANEKGVVEGGVRFARLNFFVPVPQVRDFDELNTYLLQCGQEDLSRRLRGHTGTKVELLVHDREAFLPLPAVPSPVGTRPPRPVRCRWCGSTTTITRCRCAGRIIRWWCMGTTGKWCCARVLRKWRDIGGSGSGNKSALSRCITWRCWSANPVRWIMPGRWPVGSYPSVSPRCGVAWRTSGRATAHGNTSGCCGCWRSIPWPRFARRSNKPCGWGR